MSTFEGHEKHVAQQPSGKQFPAHTAPQSAEGNGALPPGANTFRVNKRKGGKTTAAFVAKVGG